MTRAPAVACALAALVLAAPARAQTSPPVPNGPRLEVAAGDVSVLEVLERWAAAAGKVLQADPQLQPIRLRLHATATFDALMLRHVLDMHDVVLVERDGVLEAHHRRNLPHKAGPPWDHVEGLAPRSDRLVTCVVPIRHGAGAAIFATLRGLMTRDTNRVGNILYLQGPELLLLVDFGHQVRYYQELIATLDRPPPLAERRMRLSVYEVDGAWWAKQQAAERAAGRLAALLAGAPGDAVTLLTRCSLLGSEPVAFERTLGNGVDRAHLMLEVGPAPAVAAQGGDAPPAAPRGEGLHVRLHLDLGGLRLVARARFAAGDAAALQSYTGRTTPRATDVVVVIEQE